MKYMSQGAIFCPDRIFRYRLWRTWDLGASLLWVMMNPSTADENVLDPTLRKCEGFSRRWGYAGFEVCNLYAYRATDPQDLIRAGMLVGPDNDKTIYEAACFRRGHEVMVGWGGSKVTGRHAKDYRKRAADVGMLLVQAGARPHCFKINASGHPKHPLYVGYPTARIPFDVKGLL